MNFIDYPVTLDAIAGGDLVCWCGSWRKVTHVEFKQDYDHKPQYIMLEGSNLQLCSTHLPVARIAWPLLEALGRKDPFRG